MDMNEQEKEAVLKKIDNPKEVVLCPTCGNELLYEAVGTSARAYCKNDSHIEVTLRGI